jgi:hypothetical protein
VSGVDEVPVPIVESDHEPMRTPPDAENRLDQRTGGCVTLSLGVVAGAMMVCYIAVLARLIGRKPAQSKRDKLTTSAVGAALGATVCTPPYLLGRLGILMLGSKVLLIPGAFVLAVAVTLQAGATGAVRAIKMTASLGKGRAPRRSPHDSHRLPARAFPASQRRGRDRGRDPSKHENRLCPHPGCG